AAAAPPRTPAGRRVPARTAGPPRQAAAWCGSCPDLPPMMSASAPATSASMPLPRYLAIRCSLPAGFPSSPRLNPVAPAHASGPARRSLSCVPGRWIWLARAWVRGRVSPVWSGLPGSGEHGLDLQVDLDLVGDHRAAVLHRG